MAASSSQQADSVQGNHQQTSQQAYPDSDATAPEATQPKHRKGQMTLKWTFGEGSGVGSEFEVLARWLNPHGLAAAGETNTTLLVNALQQRHQNLI